MMVVPLSRCQASRRGSEPTGSGGAERFLGLRATEGGLGLRLCPLPISTVKLLYPAGPPEPLAPAPGKTTVSQTDPQPLPGASSPSPSVEDAGPSHPQEI